MRLRELLQNWAENNYWLVCDYRWGRRLIGGRWELWYVEHPVYTPIWHWIDDATKRSWWWETFHRPTPLCRGTPLAVEEWCDMEMQA